MQSRDCTGGGQKVFNEILEFCPWFFSDVKTHVVMKEDSARWSPVP